MTSRHSTGASEARQASDARDHRQLLASAVAAAVRATDIIRARSADLRRLTWQEKSTTDFVSEVDIAAEEAIRELLHARHPDAVIVGEELTPDRASHGGLAFVADPLDGTTNFLHGFPWYAVSIAALIDDRLVAGAVLNVANGELFTATAGGGARRNGEPIAVSGITDPSRALIGTGFPFKHLDRLHIYQRQFAAIARSTAGMRRAGAAALDLADVACGRFEGFWELTLAPWDIAAGILLIREAGGVVTDLNGDPARVAHTAIVAGSEAMHPWLLGTLREAASSAE